MFLKVRTNYHTKTLLMFELAVPISCFLDGYVKECCRQNKRAQLPDGTLTRRMFQQTLQNFRATGTNEGFFTNKMLLTR